MGTAGNTLKTSGLLLVLSLLLLMAGALAWGVSGVVIAVVVALVMNVGALWARDFTISRTREFQADAFGAQLSGKPLAHAFDRCPRPRTS